MGNLFDELKKAKLIDKKKAKQLAHEQRVEKSNKGGDRAADAEQAAKDAEYKAQREEARKLDRQRERERQEAERAHKDKHELLQLVASRICSDAAGSKRWHFVTPNGTVPYLPVNEHSARKLESGELAIVVDPSVRFARYVIVPREVATKLEASISGSICFVAGG